MKETKNNFGKFGVVLAAAGSAVGLGNIWKFPYMIGENGGAAFLIVYLGCVLLFGIPLMTSEFYVGKSGLKNWRWIHGLTAVSSTLFFAFYLVVTGWCFEYLYLSIINATSGLCPTQLENTFQAFSNSIWMPLLWAVIAIVLTALIELAGVKSGIERANKTLMPLLLVMLLVMIIRGLTLPGSSAGLRFLLEPNFSKITPNLILSAMGQCFFSLSIGVGTLATYAHYMREEQDLPITSARVIGLDTLVAILAGAAIFPAVFALGINPTEGPELVFVTLPSMFGQMRAGYALQIAFFLLLSIAALTSTISLMEVELHFLQKTLKMSRIKGILLSSGVVLGLCLIALLYKPVFGWLDQLVSLYLLPFGGLVFAIYVGWRCPKDHVLRHMTPQGCPPFFGQVLYTLVRYFIPPTILLIFLQGIGAV